MSPEGTVISGSKGLIFCMRLLEVIGRDELDLGYGGARACGAPMVAG